jgi:hypothetical protein
MGKTLYEAEEGDLTEIFSFISQQSTDIKLSSAIAKTMVFSNGFHDIFNGFFVYFVVHFNPYSCY